MEVLVLVVVLVLCRRLDCITINDEQGRRSGSHPGQIGHGPKRLSGAQDDGSQSHWCNAFALQH